MTLLAPDAALSAVVSLALFAADACAGDDAAAAGEAADAADAVAPAPELAAFARSAPGGNGGTDVPRPASGVNSIAFVRNGRCGSRTISTFVCCLACQ